MQDPLIGKHIAIQIENKFGINSHKVQSLLYELIVIT